MTTKLLRLIASLIMAVVAPPLAAQVLPDDLAQRARAQPVGERCIGARLLGRGFLGNRIGKQVSHGAG